ncbi:MAG: CoA-binding protein [Candidatus Sericytochromatia bacterium]|nr:CoA-binding protein [Candidatus Sericytochromatia bacterium]
MTQISKNEMKKLLKDTKTIAIVGLSSKSERPSYGVAEYLQNYGYKIYPVNPAETEVLGEKSYPDLKSLPVIPDLVNVFRKSETVLPIVDEAIEIGVKFIWFQLGVINDEAIKKSQDNNINVVVDKCLAVEHRLLGL